MKEKALEFFKGIGTIILFILLSFIGNILLGRKFDTFKTLNLHKPL